MYLHIQLPTVRIQHGSVQRRLLGIPTVVGVASRAPFLDCIAFFTFAVLNRKSWAFCFPFYLRLQRSALDHILRTSIKAELDFCGTSRRRSCCRRAGCGCIPRRPNVGFGSVCCLPFVGAHGNCISVAADFRLGAGYHGGSSIGRAQKCGRISTYVCLSTLRSARYHLKQDLAC